jgi:hypothetical protein
MFCEAIYLASMFGPHAGYAGERSFRDFFRLPPTKENRRQSVDPACRLVSSFVNGRCHKSSLDGTCAARFSAPLTGEGNAITNRRCGESDLACALGLSARRFPQDSQASRSSTRKGVCCCTSTILRRYPPGRVPSLFESFILRSRYMNLLAAEIHQIRRF